MPGQEQNGFGGREAYGSAPTREETNFLAEQENKTRMLRFLTREVTFGARRGFSSPEFRKVKQDLYKLDKYLKTLNGRTKLTEEEMRYYEYYTNKVYDSASVYLRKKQAAINARKDAKGNVKISLYEKKRIMAIKRVQQDIFGMRKDMYEPELKKQKDEMQKRCSEKIAEMKETLDSVAHAEAKNENLKPVLKEAVVNTLFYLNRMSTLEKSFRIKPGETLDQTKNRMNRNLEPRPRDKEKIAGHELTESIVEAGMKAIKEGKQFTADDIQRLQNEYIKKNARKIMEQKRRRANLQGLRRQPQDQAQVQNPQAQAQNPQQQVENPQRQVQNPQRQVQNPQPQGRNTQPRNPRPRNPEPQGRRTI